MLILPQHLSQAPLDVYISVFVTGGVHRPIQTGVAEIGTADLLGIQEDGMPERL